MATNANKGIYNGKEVIVLERNYIYDYAKIKTGSSKISLYISLSELKSQQSKRR